MKVIQYQAYGNSDVMHLNEIEKPTIATAKDVLVKVKAFSVNPLDMKIRQGYMQNMFPITFPYIPGLDASGIVEAIGYEVKNVKVGDEVLLSARGGTYAEYFVAQEHNVALKPSNISFEEATSLVVPIATAQSLLNVGNVQKDQKILIQGASGAVGTVLIQMAKSLGAYLIGTASGKGIELIQSLGADEAIDYKTQDFTKIVSDADLVIDCAGGPSQNKLFEVIKKGGKLLSITMPPSTELAEQFGVEAQFVSSDMSMKNLEKGLQLVSEGKLKPIVSKVLFIDASAEAQDLVSSGGVNGKIVLTT